MKIKLWTGICFLLVFLTLIGASSAQKNTLPSEASELSIMRGQFKKELRSVRVEMLQQGVAFQDWKIKQIDREIQRLRLERERHLRGPLLDLLSEERIRIEPAEPRRRIVVLDDGLRRDDEDSPRERLGSDRFGKGQLDRDGLLRQRQHGDEEKGCDVHAGYCTELN